MWLPLTTTSTRFSPRFQHHRSVYPGNSHATDYSGGLRSLDDGKIHGYELVCWYTRRKMKKSRVGFTSHIPPSIDHPSPTGELDDTPSAHHPFQARAAVQPCASRSMLRWKYYDKYAKERIMLCTIPEAYIYRIQRSDLSMFASSILQLPGIPFVVGRRVSDLCQSAGRCV
jgi:hypothetical protein